MPVVPNIPPGISDDDMIDTRYHYMFIHNVFADFVHDTLKYFSEYLYPRFNYTVVGTYDKAVEYIKKKEVLDGREEDKPNLPALVLNPTGEFNLDDSGHGARQQWRFPNLAPGFIKRIFHPIYKDQNIVITPGFTRIKGQFEMLALCASFYEYFDLRLYLLQIFAGEDRYINPLWFNSIVILPSKIVNYEYKNDVTGEEYFIDWEKYGAKDMLIRTTNQNEVVIPCNIKPRFRMNSLSDASERYGGTDSISSYKLRWNLEYEVEIPTFLVLDTNYLAEKIHMEINYQSIYSKYVGQKAPKTRRVIESNWNIFIDSTSSDYFETTLPDKATILEDKNFELVGRFLHIITQQEIDSTSNIVFTLPEQIDGPQYIILMSMYGQLQYWDHYRIIENNTKIEILKDFVSFKKGDVMEIFLYKDITDD